jgi:hypothetical protein
MVAFEAFKLKVLRSPGWKRKRYALATDAQDHMVNWQSRDRRIGIQLSTISIADNYTGFILRTDVNFDPTSGDVVELFSALVEAEDFSIPEGLGHSDRYVLPSFFRAVGHVLKSGTASGVSELRREELLLALEALCPDFTRDSEIASDRRTRFSVIAIRGLRRAALLP